MDSYSFYKSIFDRELNRRKDLDTAINLPITILTIIVASNSYLLTKKNIEFNTTKFSIYYIVFILIFISFSVSVFYLIRSYNNLFKGFGYRNLGYTKEIRDFEILKIKDYNIQVTEEEKLNFENLLIDKLNSITDGHIIFNDKRALDLYRTKTGVIVTLILTAINFLIFTLEYLIK